MRGAMHARARHIGDPHFQVMIVLLALLNDGVILSIAYDRVHYSDESEAWNMPVVLGMVGVRGLRGRGVLGGGDEIAPETGG